MALSTALGDFEQKEAVVSGFAHTLIQTPKIPIHSPHLVEQASPQSPLR
jgi:hypothetical protein